MPFFSKTYNGLADALINDVEAFSGDILDYDVLIGMDVITKLDLTLTNNPNTVFSFRYPSEGNVELK